MGAAGLGVVVSGLLVNVYIAVVARALPPAEYATFGAFWALALVLGFGPFLPLEQELSRRLAGASDHGAQLRAGRTVAAALAVLAVSGVLAASPLVSRALDDDLSSLLALVVLCLVSAGQFLLRAVLIGTDRLVRHGAVMVLDAVLRLVLAAAVFVAGGGDAAAFGWALVVAIALSHLPLLPGAWRRASGAPASDRHVPSPVRATALSVLPLLVGSLCAQLLLNGLPAAVVAAAPEEAEAPVGVFIAAFTLLKAPLSLVVPLQSAVVPTLARLLAAGRRREVAVLLGRGAAVLAGLALVGAPLAAFAGPAIVRLVFGADYVIGGPGLALIAVGVLTHVGLVVVTQVHVARGRHGHVALSWVAGLVAAAVAFWLVPGPVRSGEVAFGVGSAVGVLVSVLLLVPTRTRGPVGPAGSGGPTER